MTPALSKAFLLVVPSGIGLALCLLHGFLSRRRAAMLSFVVAVLLFGILRGNVIHWITVESARGAGAVGAMPYVITTPVIRILHATLQECIGWAFALYLAWSLSASILKRAGLENRLFALAGLSYLFMACISYAVEAGAGALHWWAWTIPVASRYLLDVPPVGLWDWSSVAFDFLMPFLVMAFGGRALGARRWGLALLFPLHMVAHAADQTLVPIEGALFNPSEVCHWLMLISTILLALMGTARLEDEGKKSVPPWARALPCLAAAMLLAVLWVGIGPVAQRWDLLVTTAPLLVFVLLAVPGIPLWVPCAVAVACTPLAGWRGGVVLVPILAFGLLAASRAHARDWKFRLALAAGVVLLAFGAIFDAFRLRQCGEAYMRMRLETGAAGRRPADADLEARICRVERAYSSATELHMTAAAAFKSLGKPDLVVDEYRRAIRLEPEYARAHSELGMALFQCGLRAEALPELETAARLLPSIPELHLSLGAAYRETGQAARARDTLLRAVAQQPDFVDARLELGLAYTDMGEDAKAGEQFQRALALAPGNLEAIFHLGVLCRSAGDFDRARRFFEQGLPLCRDARQRALFQNQIENLKETGRSARQPR